MSHVFYFYFKIEQNFWPAQYFLFHPIIHLLPMLPDILSDNVSFFKRVYVMKVKQNSMSKTYHKTFWHVVSTKAVTIKSQGEKHPKQKKPITVFLSQLNIISKVFVPYCLLLGIIFKIFFILSDSLGE